MNIGTIVTPNRKGQVVIPQKIRKALSITSDVSLNITMRGKGIYIYPVKEVIVDAEEEPSYLQVLKKTKGKWAGDDWDKMRKRRRKIELEASKKRKEAW